MSTDYIIRRTDPANGQILIKPYTANGPANPSATFPLYSGATSANSPLKLLGRSSADIGEPWQTNLINILENFSNSTAPAFPLEGQLWFNNSTNTLNVRTSSSWVGVLTNPMSQNLSMGSFRIVSVANPISSQDVATKDYTDITFLALSGGTLTGGLTISSGQLTVPTTATLGNHVPNKTYVDTQVSTLSSTVVHTTGTSGMVGVFQFDPGSTVAIDGSAFTLTACSVSFAACNVSISSNVSFSGAATITFGNRVVNGVSTPLISTDAANKGYIDGLISGITSNDILSGTFDPNTGTLSLVQSIGSPIVIPNFPSTSDIISTANPNYNSVVGVVTNNSVIATEVSNYPSYPEITVNAAITAIDTVLSHHTKPRMKFFGPIIGTTASGKIASATSTVSGVVVGGAGSGSFDVDGDLTGKYAIGSHIRVVGNTGSPDFTYQVRTVTYNSGPVTTTVGVVEAVPVGTTPDGSVVATYGSFTLAGVLTEIYKTGTIITITSGPAVGTYTVALVTAYSGNTILEISSTTPVTVASTTSGFGIASIILPFTYTTEHHKLMVFVDGIKQYKSIRGRSIITLAPGSKSTDLVPISTGITYQATIDTIPSTAPVLLSITKPSNVSATIISIDFANSKIVISGDYTNNIYSTQNIILTDSTPTSGTHTNLNSTYVVSRSAFDGTNTTIVVVGSMVDPITFGSGMTLSLPVWYDYNALNRDINQQLTVGGLLCSSMVEDSAIVIYTNTTSTQQVAIIDAVTNGLVIGMSGSIITGYNTSALFYTENGAANVASNSITINSFAGLTGSSMVEILVI